MASSSSPGPPKSKKLRKTCDGLERLKRYPFEDQEMNSTPAVESSSTALPEFSSGRNLLPYPSPQPARPFKNLVLSSPALDESTLPLSLYDVFICHCGNDTKHTLANTIYERLKAFRKKVFLDQPELKLGHYFPLNIKNAIDTVSFRIVIFSPNFAKSPWCLEELRLMLQTSITFIPIFYHVEPYILRWAFKGKGNGIYADDISELENKEDNNKKRYNNDQLEEWKSALHQASFYIGEIISDQLDEKAVTKVVDRVVDRVLKVSLDVGKHDVRLDELKQEFEKKIAHQSKPIKIVGILGKGGAGKTTLARYIYKEIFGSFTRSSFLFNIREAARKELMYKKQNELLKDLGLDTESKDVENIDFDKIMKSQLKQHKVLIVLDNVDHINQLDALLPANNKFCQGSLIIVTTCKDQVLAEWGISCIYPIPKLTDDHAHQLFCWHAFGHPSASKELKELAQKFTYACHGLPLSLVVLGSQLYGLGKSYWQSQFDMLSGIVSGDISRILPNDILNISYNALNNNEQEIFLDISCFFDGWPRNEAIATYGLHDLQKLVNKCFIETYEKDQVTTIRMSDHLREFGREIANKPPFFRLWSKNQIITIQHEEAMQIRGMADAFGENWYLRDGEIILRTNQRECKLAPGSLGLKIFAGKGDFIDEKCGEISRELEFFCCDRFPHKNLPSWLPMQKLKILQLSKPEKLEGLWKRYGDAPSQLKQLLISNGCELRWISILRTLTSLEKLTISDCTPLNTFPSLPGATSLKEINLIRCNKLERIKCLGSLTSLETMIIHYCTKLTTLSSLGEAASLKKFDLRGCDKLMKIESLGRLTSLQTVKIHNCSALKTLPSLRQATRLKILEAVCCSKLEMNESFNIPGLSICISECRKSRIRIY